MNDELERSVPDWFLRAWHVAAEFENIRTCCARTAKAVNLARCESITDEPFQKEIAISSHACKLHQSQPTSWKMQSLLYAQIIIET